MGGGIFAPWTLKAATDNQLAVNPDTGLAISGFDPVAISRMARRCSGGQILN
jgi:hypothetical protein